MATVTYVSTFAERFSELTEGKTVVEAGELLGISKATVSAYKTGARSPKTPVLKHIAAYYKVDPLWLMGMDVPKYNSEAPAGEGEGMSEDRAYLINKVKSLSDEDVRALRTIVDQVLALREK